MTEVDDWQLLDRYVRDHAYGAFGHRRKILGNGLSRRAIAAGRANAILAEDVTQAVFIVLARRAGRLRNRGSLGAWLHKTALYASATAVRAESRRRRHEQAAAIPECSATFSDESSELPAAIDKAMQRLRWGDRQIIGLHYLEDRPMAETAHLMNLSPETGKCSRLRRAIDRLRQKLPPAQLLTR